MGYAIVKSAVHRTRTLGRKLSIWNTYGLTFSTNNLTKTCFLGGVCILTHCLTASLDAKENKCFPGLAIDGVSMPEVV